MINGSSALSSQWLVRLQQAGIPVTSSEQIRVEDMAESVKDEFKKANDPEKKATETFEKANPALPTYTVTIHNKGKGFVDSSKAESVASIDTFNSGRTAKKTNLDLGPDVIVFKNTQSPDKPAPNP